MQITINGERRRLVGNPPLVGEMFPSFLVENKEGKKVSSQKLLGKVTLLSVVPNIDTPVCSLQTKHFNSQMDRFTDVNFWTISTNTVAQQQKWCAAQGVKKMQLVSDQEESFGNSSQLLIAGEDLLARSVWILDQQGRVVYRQIVAELTDEPDYERALTKLQQLV